MRHVCNWVLVYQGDAFLSWVELSKPPKSSFVWTIRPYGRWHLILTRNKNLIYKAGKIGHLWGWKTRQLGWKDSGTIPAAIKRLDHYHQGRPEYKTHLMQMPSDQEEIRVIFQLFLKATFYYNVLLKHQQLLHQH